MTKNLFSVEDQIAFVTGGAGMLCDTICRALAQAEEKIAVMDFVPGTCQGTGS